MNLIKVLTKRNVALLLGAQAVSAIGSVTQSFALSLFVLGTGSGVKFATVLAVGMIPRLFGPLTGVVVDRVNRKRLLVVLDILSGFLVLAFALIHNFIGPLTMPAIYTLVLCLSALQAFDDPATSAILPDVAERQELTDANSVSSTISNFAYIIVPVLAGLLLNVTGLFPLMLINSASFFLAASLEGSIRYRHHRLPANLPASEEGAEPAKPSSVMHEFWEGIHTITGSRELILIVGVSVLANLALNPFFNVGIPYMLRINLGVSDELYGLAQSVIFAGPVLGSVLAGFVLKRVDYKPLLGWLLAADTVLVAVAALVAPALSGSFSLWRYGAVCLMAFSVVATMALASVATITAMQKIVPGALMGRVAGAVTSMAMIAIPLGQWLYGYQLDVWSSTAAGLFFAGLVFVGCVFSIVMRRAMDRAERMSKGGGAGVTPASR